MLEKKEMDGSETKVSGGREPLELISGEKYYVAIRGLGVYFGGAKKDFDTGELIEGEKIENAALVVCNPKDAEEEYIVSAPVDSVMGKGILTLGKREDEVWWLRDDLVNVVGWLGMQEVKTKEEYEYGYKQLFFDADMKKDGTMKKMKNAPAGFSLVGADQRGIEVGEEMVDEGLI